MKRKVFEMASVFLLCGWYLLTPKMQLSQDANTNFTILNNAPLSQWINSGPFDSAKECSEQKAKDIAKARKNKIQSVFKAISNEACIATDDPRLAK